MARHKSSTTGLGLWSGALAGSVSRESLIFGFSTREQVEAELSLGQGQGQGAVGAGAVIDLSSSTQHLDTAARIDLFPLRLNWDRLSFALAGPALGNFSQFPQVASLQRKMARVCARSRYVDDFEVRDICCIYLSIAITHS